MLNTYIERIVTFLVFGISIPQYALSGDMLLSSSSILSYVIMMSMMYIPYAYTKEKKTYAHEKEIAWFGKRSRLNKLVNMEQTATVGASVIQPAAVVQDLGVILDQELGMTQHIAKVTSSCFYQLRPLRQIRRPVVQELVTQLVH